LADGAKILTGGVNSPDGARCSLALLRDIKESQQAIDAPEQWPFPVIISVHGHILGLGVDIVSVCDIRYAAERTQFNIKVRHYFPHFFIEYLRYCAKDADIALAADVSSLAYLPKIVCHHSLLCKFAFSVADAQRVGLFSCVIPGGRAFFFLFFLRPTSVPCFLRDSCGASVFPIHDACAFV
jgi:delta(3,5)-delta(2,4)-dienoyl-CoA isomerase